MTQASIANQASALSKDDRSGFASLLQGMPDEAEVDDETFHALLVRSADLGVTSRQIADKSAMNVSAVDRWIEGRSRPHLALRPRLFRIIGGLVAKAA